MTYLIVFDYKGHNLLQQAVFCPLYGLLHKYIQCALSPKEMRKSIRFIEFPCSIGLHDQKAVLDVQICNASRHIEGGSGDIS